MRLNFIREGKRFFFVTLVTAGRRPVLSRRVRDEIVELMPAGQRVKDHWATSHRRDEAVTASNFVIMPDHAHFLLIVDFEKRRDSDVLDWIMHFVRETGDWELWDRHLYFQLSFSVRQLKAIRRYIKMNPARAWWKESHPDMFVRRGGLRHEMLDPSYPWTAFGNLTLLANPFLYQVRLTTKKTVAELEGEIAEAADQPRQLPCDERAHRGALRAGARAGARARGQGRGGAAPEPLNQGWSLDGSRGSVSPASLFLPRSARRSNFGIICGMTGNDEMKHAVGRQGLMPSPRTAERSPSTRR